MDPLPALNHPTEAFRQRPRRVTDRERRRATKACDGCRRLKEKCDGGVPCRRCVRMRRQCVFVGPQPRDSRPDRVSSDTDVDQRLRYMERLLRHYAGDISLETDDLRAAVETVSKEASPRAEGVERRRSTDSDDLEAEAESFTVQPLENNATHYSGEFSHWNFSMRIKEWIDQCAVTQNQNSTSSSTNFKEYYRAEELQSSSESQTALSSLPPRYVADFLVQAFFQHGETNYFYVEKGWLLKKLDFVYVRGPSLGRRDAASICVIFVILAIGTQYAYLDSLPRDRGQIPAGPFSEDAIGVMFYQQACKLVPDVITISSLESVQACLLIGVYAMPLDASGLSYVYLNLAVKLAILNGMHRKYPNDRLDPTIREARNRVWWTAFTTERRIGIFHGRPITIATSDVDAETPTHNTDLWPSLSAHNEMFLASIHLHQILAKIAHEISTYRAQARGGLHGSLTKLIDLKNEAYRWWNTLPESCRSAATDEILPRTKAHLHLEYCLVRMFIGRPFIFCRSRAGTNNASTSGSPLEAAAHPRIYSSGRRAGSRSILVEDCIQAALSIVDTLRHLRDSIGLARASYTEFSACRAALLVIITQCLQGRTDQLRRSLSEGLAMIKMMSSGGESAKSEASLIEVFERALARLDAVGGTYEQKGNSEYENFKTWEMLWQSGPMQMLNQGGPSAQSDPSAIRMSSEPGYQSGMGNLPMQNMTPNSAAAAAAALDWSSFSALPRMDEYSSMFASGLEGPSPESMFDPGGLSSAWL